MTHASPHTRERGVARAATPAPSRSGIRVAVLGGLVALGPLSTDAYVPGLPRIAVDLHASASQVQLTITTVLVGLALGQLVAGPLSDSFGRRRPMLVGLAVYAAASLAAAAVPDAGLLVGVRAVQGIGGATVLVVAYAMLRDLYDGPMLARRFASLLLVSGVAPVVAPLAGAAVMQVAGWRWVFVGLGLIATGLLVAAVVFLPESLPQQRRQATAARDVAGTYRRLLTDPVLLGFVVLGSSVFAAMFAYITASPFVLEDQFGLSTQAYGAAFAVNAVGLVAAAQIGGHLAARMDPRWLIDLGVGTSVTGGAALVVAALLSLGLWPLLAGLFLVVASVGLVMPNVSALALADHGAQAGTAAALLGAGQFLLGGLMAPVMAALGAASELTMAATIAAVTVLAATTSVGLHRRRPRHDEPGAGTTPASRAAADRSAATPAHSPA